MSNLEILKVEEQRYLQLSGELQQKQQAMQQAEAQVRDVSVQLLKAEGRITMLRELIQLAETPSEFPQEMTDEV